MKRILITSSLLALYGWIAAQAVISFDKKMHDFGTLKEEVGKVSHVFEFTNTGNADLELKNVQASCGCTTPEWTKTPIGPGGKGAITVTYSTIGRPGMFSKSITVTTKTDQREVLTIKGDVIKKVPPIEQQYPLVVGALRFKSKFANLANIDDDEEKTETIDFINTSKEEVSISFFDVKNYMEVNAFPANVAPNEKGIIAVTYYAKKRNEYGAQNEQFGIILNGEKKESPDYLFSVFGVIVERFTTEQLNNPPVCVLGGAIDFGDIVINSKRTAKTTITNTGTSPLIIRKISFEREGDTFMTVSASNKPIAPGKSATISVKIDAKNLPLGPANNNLILIVNEPNNTRKVIPVSYTIVSKK